MQGDYDQAFIASLREQILRLEKRTGRDTNRPAQFPTGHAGIDRHLGGGLASGTLHEVIGGGRDALFGTRAARFIASILSRSTGRVAWIGAHRLDLHAAELKQAGLNPGRLICIEVPAEQVEDLYEDALREEGLSAVVGELDAPLSLDASRRLLEGCSQNQTTGFLIPRGTFVAGSHSLPASISATRWRITPRPYLVEADLHRTTATPSHARWNVELLHQQGGAKGEWEIDMPQPYPGHCGYSAIMPADEHRSAQASFFPKRSWHSPGRASA